MFAIARMDTWRALTGRLTRFRVESHHLLKGFGSLRLLDAFDTIRPKRLLEFGHGFNPTLLAHAQGRCEAYGVDDHQELPHVPPKEEWERMHQEFMVAPCPDVRFVRGLLGVHELPELEHGSFDIVLERWARIMHLITLCRELGFAATGPVPGRIDPDPASMLMESPSPVMLTYQMGEGEQRRFDGHWTSAYFRTRRAA